MSQSKEISTKTGILMFFILFMSYILFAANWVGGSTLGPEIIKTYFPGETVSPVISQVVNYTITTARVFANFLAAFFLMKLGIRKAGILAFVFLSFALVAIWMPNYWLYIGARMIMALGGSMLMVFMNPMVVRFVAQKHKMIYSALITASYNIGAFIIALAFIVAGNTLRMDWRITMSVIASCVLILFATWLWKSEHFETTPSTNDNYSYAVAIKDAFIWKYSLSFSAFIFLYVMMLTSLPATMAKYVQELNSGMMILMVSGGGIVGTLMMMRLKIESKRKPFLLKVGSLTIALLVASLYVAPHFIIGAYVLMFLGGFVLFIQYPVYLNIPHELPNMNPQRSTLMFGVIWALTYGLYTLFNFFWSLILDNFGLQAAHIFFVGIVSVHLLMIFTLPETYVKKEK
ncbi:MFS transporter [Carnobacteriaceae bacterium zg-ZUI252]|nr:MFS transporter [Carnobacteriaceae bacterium zg-ZUI252]QTU82506.1 MFS transporter [Carnobacteriaceae bacterium zg-C25]